jgi:ATP-dependent Clp protease ATP-binding subunit ClpC
VLERFTEDARQVVVHAQEEARKLGHDVVGTEHLLLGILRLPGDGVAPGVLDRLGVTLLDARDQVARIVGRGEGASAAGQIPFTPRAQAALEGAVRETQSLGGRAVEPEHVLLGLLEQEGGVARRVLVDFDAADKVRADVLGRLAAAPRRSHGEAVVVQEARPAASSGALGVPAMVALGWFGFGAAVGIGLLLGWLIWG